MGWVAISALVLGASVLVWLGLLTWRVLKLENEAQPQSRFVPLNRTGLERVQQDVDGLHSQISVLSRDIRALFRRLDDVERILDSSPAQSQAGTRYTDTYQDARPMYEPVSRPPAEVEPPPSTALEEELREAYNALASSFATGVRDSFVAKYQPLTVAFSAGGFSETESGNFWLVAVPNSQECVVLPSGKVARDWEKLYRAMNGMQAQQSLGEVFDVAAGGQLKVEAAARALQTNGSATLVRKGHLIGI